MYDDLLIVADTCLCEYTDHGHCGVIDDHTHDVDNDKSLPLLVKTAISQVEAGADIIAPSNMMDGFVVEIRRGLDEAGYYNIPIMSYGVKYASSFFGPLEMQQIQRHHLVIEKRIRWILLTVWKHFVN